MTVPCSVSCAEGDELLLLHGPLVNVRHAWGNGRSGSSSGSSSSHPLSLDPCQGNATSINQHKAHRLTGASIRCCGTWLRKGQVKIMEMIKRNMPWVREGENPVSVGWECVVRQVGSSVWDGWTLACGSRTYGKELRSGLWFGDVVPMWGVVTATQVSHHLLLPPLPVLAVESNPKQQIYHTAFSFSNSQTFLDAMLVFWGVIFKSPACFLRSIAFSTIFFCRFKMRSSFIWLSPAWDFLFFSSCLQNEKEAMRR